MGKRDIESALEIDVTKIDFPRPIGEVEADCFLRYVVAQLDENGDSTIHITIHFSQNRHYGDRLGAIKYESPGEVKVKNSDTKIAGTITRNMQGIQLASFLFRSNYDRLDRPVFTGIDFIVTPGHKPGELISDSVELMRHMGKYSKSYFEKTDLFIG
jgi:hypothetical protein